MDSSKAWLDSIPIPTMEGDSPTLQFIGLWANRVYSHRDMIQMYIHLLLAAIFPIYVGSHASLRCPSSAEDPAKKSPLTATTVDDDDDDLEELEAESAMEGLTPSDAILFPVFASVTLAGLYFLIKWLKDPALLNKILGYYFSLLGIFGVGKLAGDALNVGTSIVFPSIWSSGTEVYYIDPLTAEQFTKEPMTRGRERTMLHRKFVDKSTPFPGSLSNVIFSEKINSRVWAVRALFRNHWVFRGHIHGLMKVKSKVKLNDVVGLLVGVAAIAAYNASGKVWWLANLMGFGFCYGTLQLMSPTTFWTGSLVLGGLFIYDIVMVFYTPLMVTVATSLDVPIKLVFPGPNRGGMLGLGDVVLPGIMMALALRFDLYLYYLRKPAPPTISLTPDTSEKRKPVYEIATGKWGERFWTRSLPISSLPPTVASAVFPKIYFYASVIGYIIGMLTTLVILNVFNHAQPALLYLVPSVLGSLWGTALFRSELKLMWNYTEASEDEETKHENTKEKMTEVEKEEKDGKEVEADKDETQKGDEVENDREMKRDKIEKKTFKADNQVHHVFLFSLSSPCRGPKKLKFLP